MRLREFLEVFREAIGLLVLIAMFAAGLVGYAALTNNL